MPTTAHKQYISSQTWRDLNWLLKSPSLVKDLAAYSSHTLLTDSERLSAALYHPAEFSSEQLQGLLTYLEHERQPDSEKLAGDEGLEDSVRSLDNQAHKNPRSSMNLDPLISKQFRRLGLYAEALLQIALEHAPHTELLLRHCQIQEDLASSSSKEPQQKYGAALANSVGESKDAAFTKKQKSTKKHQGKHTIGELDFIWRHTQSQQIYHWELAVKLYLYVPELENFVGTQKIDTLARKAKRLLEHQLPLAQHPQVQQRLGETVNQSSYYLKGWLFYPIGDKGWDDYQLAPAKMMVPLNPQHLRGWWLYHSEFASRFNDEHMRLDDLELRDTELRDTELRHTQWGQAALNSSYRWTILPRLHWLSSVVKTQEETMSTCMSDKELIEFMQAYFSASGRMDSALTEPILLSALLPGADGHWHEVHRGFVVHEDWWL